MEGERRGMLPLPESVIRQAEKLRLTGNEYYNKARFGAAIDAYTEAIVLNPFVASSWTNRAQCFRMRKVWKRVEEDCRKAIALKPSSFKMGKGHFMLGLALVEMKRFTEGIKQLEKAFDLGKAEYADDHRIREIWMALSRAKYTKWRQESSVKSSKLQNLREACRSALDKQYASKCIPYLDGRIADEAAKKHKGHLELLSVVFDDLETKHEQAEVPDYLCCKISLEILHDPVITPSGITYERAMLLDHLRKEKVGPFDPTTRKPLQPNQLVPNLAIKEAVRAFLDQNGWAYKMTDAPTIIIE